MFLTIWGEGNFTLDREFAPRKNLNIFSLLLFKKHYLINGESITHPPLSPLHQGGGGVAAS